jgi:A/G-specific adenine glycosylase
VNTKTFQSTILSYYRANKRHFAWRETLDPYAIMVSEIMLQQTQTDRVIPKYKHWLKKFPNFETLAKAQLRDVLREWQGLGYNRRALALKRAAGIVVEKYHGTLPKDYEKILELPGIGPYTAGAIMAFAFNKPFPIIETNIRTVFIHFFFASPKLESSKSKGGFGIHDKEILKLVEKTLDRKNVREWYYALMDYGVMLKKTHGNLNQKSKHYTKQSTFKGSNRELRANIVRLISKKPSSLQTLSSNLDADRDNIKMNLGRLEKEGFIKLQKSVYYIN